MVINNLHQAAAAEVEINNKITLGITCFLIYRLALHYFRISSKVRYDSTFI